MANFATCVVFLSFLTRRKRRKMAFFEGCPVEWAGYPPELAWPITLELPKRVDGGVLGWVGWGVGAGWQSKSFGSGRVGVLFFESWRVDLVSRHGLPRAVWGSGKGWFQRKGLGLGWLFQRGASPGKGWLAWQFHRRGQGLGGQSKGFGTGKEVCYFSKVGGLTS